MAAKGFFAPSTLIGRPPTPTIPRCGVCKLSKGCKTPKIFAQGEGRKGIMIVSRPPNAFEDAAGELGRGKSGQYLRTALSRCGIDLAEDCWIAGALACSPGKRSATKEQIGYCRPSVLSAIKTHKPRVIILMGTEAVSSVIYDAWKPGGHQLETFNGFAIPSTKYNAWICPIDHPDHITNDKNQNQKAIELIWFSNLQKAVKRKVRPWINGPPNLIEKIEPIVDTKQAAQLLRVLSKKKRPIAFDYETNCLNPFLPKSRIVSASVCFGGDRTIAFPMDSYTNKALAELLKSSAPKIAANLKFEDKWSRAKLRVAPRNWVWDTMLAAHWLDSRQKITGLKIQSFIHLGLPEWNASVEPYLGNVGDSPYNNIHKIGVMDLLRYNGLDSLIEYHLASHQIEAGGVSKHVPGI